MQKVQRPVGIEIAQNIDSGNRSKAESARGVFKFSMPKAISCSTGAGVSRSGVLSGCRVMNVSDLLLSASALQK